MAASEPLLSVDEALARVLSAAREPLPAEDVSVADAHERTLAEPLRALRTQPPFPASAMDGYAVRATDAQAGASLAVIGEAPAGRAFPGSVGPAQAVRIFTGAPVPEGADAILIQENATAADGLVTVNVAPQPGQFVRPAGLDFREGEAILPAGLRLAPRTVALAAAMGHARVRVRRAPRVGILATGDELVRPGEEARPDQIVASNTYALAGLVRRAGGIPLDLGIAGDTFAALEAAITRAVEAGADVLVTLGGASVGDHDLVQSALARRGMELGFWRIAMRPGKPLIFGRLESMAILGLPGNPVSSIVCGRLFLLPLLRALQGDPHAAEDPSEPAVLGAELRANDSRQDYLRARLERDAEGALRAVAFGRQDSSMLRLLAEADCLIVRPPHAPAARAGDPCRIVRL
ncbi:molybdopterin molybdenumtransferase MoeA [Alsobacter soli]|uniref:Molybdopterin molybdenumtransferase n=1 Tax=Alsobacter soli TaxID=2109933 RepID=A0A2T1HS34_9HYPH|nr:gephyrin-like molybdotransferase Glp [Alsobacter soli]PSC04442.1 molybdopterin molybdenumtransferase MoeA [Alsobacter soli]